MTDRQERNLKSYCSEPLELVENYMAAKADDFEGWCMHHRREIKLDGTRVSIQELKDQGLYYDRPASELIFMRNGEHSTLHNKDKVISVETRLKMSEAKKGKQFSAEHRKKLSEAHKGKHHSVETRKKMSEAQKCKQFSAEHRKKLSEAHKGKHHSVETRLKMSEALSGENHPLFGKHHSEETRLKMSEALKVKLWWNNGISSKRSKECPGPEWKPGRILKP